MCAVDEGRCIFRLNFRRSLRPPSFALAFRMSSRREPPCALDFGAGTPAVPACNGRRAPCLALREGKKLVKSRRTLTNMSLELGAGHEQAFFEDTAREDGLRSRRVPSAAKPSEGLVRYPRRAVVVVSDGTCPRVNPTGPHPKEPGSGPLGAPHGATRPSSRLRSSLLSPASDTILRPGGIKVRGASIGSDGTCPGVSPSVLARKSRAPGGRGPHAVPPVLTNGLFRPAPDIVLALVN